MKRIFFLLVILCSLLNAAADHEAVRPGKKPATPPAQAPNRSNTGTLQKRVPQGGCPMRGTDLAAIANGEANGLSAIVSFLGDGACQQVAPQIAYQARKEGVAFNEVPFRLKQFADRNAAGSVASEERFHEMLRRSVASTLIDHPVRSNESMPILGQLAILSRPTARFFLAQLIRQELMDSDSVLNKASADTSVGQLASQLVRFGANLTPIAMELAETVEEMAVASQADSLGAVLRSLSKAAGIEESLLPTFSLSTAAARRGIEHAVGFYNTAQKDKMMIALISLLTPGLIGNSSMDNASQEINDAFESLIGTKNLSQVALKDVWRKILDILSQTDAQTTLAQAFASSVTGDVVYLGKEDKEKILRAASNYPELALAIQDGFLVAWKKASDEMRKGEIKSSIFNERKERFFVPWAASILDWETDLVHPLWLTEALSRGLIRDELIEARFPQHVLSLFQRRERSMKTTMRESTIKPAVGTFAENLTVLWTLSNAHIPALTTWVKKHENE